MGFGSPAADYVEPKLDLNRLLAQRPISTYYLRMNSGRLQSEGIFKGDILVVDRSLIPQPRQLVVAERSDGFCVVRFVPRPQSETTPSCVWGVVTSVIRQLC